MRDACCRKPLLTAIGLVLGGILITTSAVALADADDTGGPAYGPGMMWRSQGSTATDRPTSGYAYGPGMMQGYGAGAWSGYGPQSMRGYGYGPGMMWGGGYGRGGYGYGPGMMRGGGYGRGGYGYGPGMMWGDGYGRGGYGYGPGMMWGGGYGRGGPSMMWGGGYARGGYGYGPGMMFGAGFGPGMMWGGGWAFANAGLKLTAQQRQRLESIQSKAWQKGWSLMGQLHEERFSLFRLMASPNPDRKAVDAAYAKLSATGRQLLDLRLETRQSALGVLTTQQRKQLGQQ